MLWLEFYIVKIVNMKDFFTKYMGMSIDCPSNDDKLWSA